MALQRIRFLFSTSFLLFLTSNSWVIKQNLRRNYLSLSLEAKKFSQPAFRQSAFDKEKRPRKYGADGKIASIHSERLATAGRVGTKRYLDPCKVFFGNMPFDVDESKLESWLSDQMGQPPALLLNDCNVVRDWKTGKSKGFGFAVFTEPIYATVCIEKCNGRLIGGRKVSVNQGKKKQDPAIYMKKNKSTELDADEKAIQAGMEEAEEDLVEMDPEEIAMLRALDPDLLPDNLQPIGSSSTDEFSDEVLFQEFVTDDDEGDFDGVWEGDDDDVELDPTSNMNREQRREAARKQKKRKLPHTGFGPPPEGDS